MFALTALVVGVAVCWPEDPDLIAPTPGGATDILYEVTSPVTERPASCSTGASHRGRCPRQTLFGEHINSTALAVVGEVVGLILMPSG